MKGAAIVVLAASFLTLKARTITRRRENPSKDTAAVRSSFRVNSTSLHIIMFGIASQNNSDICKYKT